MDETTAAFLELINAEFPDWDLDNYNPNHTDLYEPAPILRKPKDEDR